MLRIWIPKFVSEFEPVLAEYDDSSSEDEEEAEFVPVIASFQVSRFLEARITQYFFRMFFIHLVNPQRCFTCTAFMNLSFPCVADAYKIES